MRPQEWIKVKEVDSVQFNTDVNNLFREGWILISIGVDGLGMMVAVLQRKVQEREVVNGN